MIPPSTYMTTEEVADLLRFTATSLNPTQSAWKWIKRHGLRVYPRGRRVLVLRAAVMAELGEKPKRLRSMA